jgi:proline iminopeptidase
VGPYTIAQSLADLAAVCDHIGTGPVTLLGHSWGATLALWFALRQPDRVSRLIYVSGTGIDADHTWQPAFQDQVRSRLGAHLQQWESLRDRPRTPAEAKEFAILQWSAEFADSRTAMARAERLATPWFGINDECNRAISAEVRQFLAENDVAGMCRSLTVPTLIVDGEQDIRPRRAVDSLAGALPNAHRAVIPDAGHLPWLEQPSTFREAIVRFLGPSNG